MARDEPTAADLEATAEEKANLPAYQAAIRVLARRADISDDNRWLVDNDLVHDLVAAIRPLGADLGRAWAIDRLRDRTAYERWRYLAANETARTDWSANMLAADFLAAEGEATT